MTTNSGDTTIDEQYFDSYADLEIHQLMLEDEERMNSYKLAIMNNKEYLKGKIVMDVGAGSGVLSIFCAMADAKKVYAIEASSLADIAKGVVKENKLDHIIEVIHGKVEEIELTDNEKVDVIVSEWMGFYLLHEGMLDSIIFARDKFLKIGGHLFPESATIYMAPCRVSSMYEFWQNVHGIKMNTIAKTLRKNKSNKPEIMKITEDDLLCEKTALCWIDIRENTVEDLNVFTMQQVLGSSKIGNFQGMCIWFECQFPVMSGNSSEPAVMLCTAPWSPQTHWKQTVIVLPEEEIVETGQPIAWELTMKRNEENSRRYDLQLVLLDPNDATHPVPCSCYMTKCIVIKEYMNQNSNKEY